MVIAARVKEKPKGDRGGGRLRYYIGCKLSLISERIALDRNLDPSTIEEIPIDDLRRMVGATRLTEAIDWINSGDSVWCLGGDISGLNFPTEVAPLGPGLF